MTTYYITKRTSNEPFTMSADSINEVRRKMIEWGAEKNTPFHVETGNRYIGVFCFMDGDGTVVPKYYWADGTTGKVYSVNPATGTITAFKPTKKPKVKKAKLDMEDVYNNLVADLEACAGIESAANWGQIEDNGSQIIVTCSLYEGDDVLDDVLADMQGYGWESVAVFAPVSEDEYKIAVDRDEAIEQYQRAVKPRKSPSKKTTAKKPKAKKPTTRKPTRRK